MNFQIAPLEKLNRLRLGELPADPYRFPFWKPEDSEPASETTEQPESQSLPPIVQVSPRDIGDEVAELCAPISAYLDAFVIAEQTDSFDSGYSNPLSTAKPVQPQPSPEAAQFEARKADLVRDLGTWKNVLQKLLEDHRQWLTAQLQGEHADAWREAREQKTLVASVVAKANEGHENLRRLKFEVSKTRAAVNAHAAARPNLASLPTQTQIDIWEHNDTELRTNLQVAQEALDTAQDHQRDVLREHNREASVLTKLLQHEADLRRRLQGSGVNDGLRGEL